jgi:predicted MFS family arabinose efflux permease
VLSDRHGRRRDRALIEANAVAGACAVVAPLALGFLAGTPATWGSAMALPAVFFAVLYLVYRQLPLPLPARPAGPAAAGRTARLPVTCWLLALLVAVGIGIEFCVVYFGAELLSAGAGLSAAAAATSMAVFYAGIFAGRVGAGVLVRRPGQGAGLLWASLAVTAAGFLAFWLSGHAVIALPGLFLTGAGVANLFPLSLALTLAAAPGRTDVANARTQLLGGLVVIAAPFLLGSLADHLGLLAAFGIVPVLIVISAGLLLSGLLSAARRPACRRRRAPGQCATTGSAKP